MHNMDLLLQREDEKLIDKIVSRVRGDIPYIDRQALTRDITTAHFIIPLRLQDFLEADNDKFYIDISGIVLNMNREENRLAGNYKPLFTA